MTKTHASDGCLFALAKQHLPLHLKPSMHTTHLNGCTVFALAKECVPLLLERLCLQFRVDMPLPPWPASRHAHAAGFKLN